jgi:hypothetical protein
MSILTNSNVASSLIRENVQGAAVDLVFRRTDLLNFLRARGAVRPWTGAYPTAWNLVTAANGSSEVYAEGSAAPVAGKQTYSRAQLSPFYTRVVVGYSGHVRDQVANGGVYEDPIAGEIQRGTVDLFKKVEDTLCGTTADQGIQSAIDAGDTYANVAPGSVTAWAAKETAVGGALTLAALQDLEEALSLTPYLSQPTDILTCHNQVNNYTDLVGPANGTAANRLARFDLGSGTIDAGMSPTGLLTSVHQFNGKPITPIAGLTNTVWLMLDMTTGVELLVARDLTVEPLAKTGDDQNLQITFACALKVAKRNAHGKLTGVTA